MSISTPFVSENGGGIFFRANDSLAHPPEALFDKGLWKLSLGVSYSRLVEALKEISLEAGINLRGFSDMTLEEICRLTALEKMDAERAAQREFDEPFIVIGEDEHSLEKIERAAQKRQLTVTRGGRFFHLQGKNDKAVAIKIINPVSIINLPAVYSVDSDCCRASPAVCRRRKVGSPAVYRSA